MKKTKKRESPGGKTKRETDDVLKNVSIRVCC
jgi:hypothetical protein